MHIIDSYPFEVRCHQLPSWQDVLPEESDRDQQKWKNAPRDGVLLKFSENEEGEEGCQLDQPDPRESVHEATRQTVHHDPARPVLLARQHRRYDLLVA